MMFLQPLLLAATILCAHGGEEGAVTIDEGSRPHIEEWQEKGHVDAPKTVSLTMALAHRNLDALDELFWRVSDPDSHEYAQYLSDKDIANRFAPSEEEVRGLEDLLRSQYSATQVSSTPLRDFLQVSLPATKAERLLGVSLCRWSAGSVEVVRACKDSTTGYSLPRSVAQIVEFVEGVVAFPALRSKRPTPSQDTPVSTPASLKAVYGIGEDVAVIGDTKQVVFGAAGQYVSPNDLNDFFANVYPQAKVRGNISFVGLNRPDHPGGEAMLDIEYIMAMGKGASTVFFYDLMLWGSLLSYVSRQNPPPSVVSVSYGQMEFQLPSFMAKSWSASFQKQALRGVTFTIASGDVGVGCHNTILGKEKFAPTFPGGSPYVLSVGGTKLDPRANWTHQVAAQFSGGGFSWTFSRPSFQDAAVAQYLSNSSMRYPDQQYWNRNGRGMPDVSLVGDNVQIWLNGGSQNTGGTSATAPQVGGLITVLNDARARKGLPQLGFVAPLFYKIARDHPDAFVDVTEGNNYAPCNMVSPCPCNGGQGAPTHAGFVAGKGWDPVTGLGAFNFPKLLEYVLQAGVRTPAPRNSNVHPKAGPPSSIGIVV